MTGLQLHGFLSPDVGLRRAVEFQAEHDDVLAGVDGGVAVAGSVTIQVARGKQKAERILHADTGSHHRLDEKAAVATSATATTCGKPKRRTRRQQNEQQHRQVTKHRESLPKLKLFYTAQKKLLRQTSQAFNCHLDGAKLLRMAAFGCSLVLDRWTAVVMSKKSEWCCLFKGVGKTGQRGREGRRAERTAWKETGTRVFHHQCQLQQENNGQHRFFTHVCQRAGHR